MYPRRLVSLLKGIESAGLDGVALNPGPMMLYLCGLPFHLMERPTVLLARPGLVPVLVLPQLESRKLEQAPYQLKAETYGDNPFSWQAAFDRAASMLDLDGKIIGVEPTRLRFLELDYLKNSAPGAKFVSAEGVLAGLRMRKDAHELLAMRKAVQIAQEALVKTLPGVRAGVSEREIASELVMNLLRCGSEPELPFGPIVSSGPNSANPHASPSDRQLSCGDLLVIDWGAACGGYFSDLTRTFAIGEVDEELRKIHALVHKANRAGVEASRPGVKAGEVDRAARSEIEAKGYGEFFTHRTGHGLGMEEHEPPYIFGENELVLAPGMTYTVEPGIYLPGRGGVRIEDNVIITSTGCECLSDFPRELISLV